jgi:hypothetical protein
MTATRLFDRGRRQRREWGGGRTDVIPYQVDAIGPGAIDWGVDGLPAKGEAHPDGLPMIARDFNASEFGDYVGSLVEVEFANGQAAYRGSAPPIPTGSEHFFNVSATEVVWDVPYAVLEGVAVNNAGDVKKEVWGARLDPLRESRAVLHARWEVQGAVVDTWPLFFRQHNRVHLIGGEKYLFTGINLIARGETSYTVDAMWLFDEGTRTIASEPGVILYPRTGLNYTPGSKLPEPGLMRDPFYTLRGAPPPSQLPEFPIRVVHRRLFDEDLNGWAAFPNVPDF